MKQKKTKRNNPAARSQRLYYERAEKIVLIFEYNFGFFWDVPRAARREW